MELLKDKFLKAYSKIPLESRQEVILFLSDNKPITWDSAYYEVNNNSALSDEILSELDHLKII